MKDLNILVLYNESTINVKCILQSLKALKKYSSYDVYYENVYKLIDGCYFKMELFDVIIIHYSICYGMCIADDYIDELSNFRGVKILMIQDDYHETERIRVLIEKINPKLVYTVVPDRYIDEIYSPRRFPNVKFINFLTGYIDIDEFENLEIIPIKERGIDIGYRGRNMGYWFGNLGQEKVRIGKYIKQVCKIYGLKEDIELEEEKRIYGEWYEFLARCKLTLGTESGSNIFDDYGNIRRLVQSQQVKNPNITYNEMFEKYLYKFEGKIKMNQISPKLFEAICCKTGLILYRGEYSNILKPYTNYIPLNKDHSNIEEVIRLAKDIDYIQNMVDETYKDIVLSEKYSYCSLVKSIEKEIGKL